MASSTGGVWAIDIGSNALKALRLRQGAEGPEVIGFDYIEHGKILSSGEVDEIEQEELIEKLTEAIQQLNERQRHIILLYYQKEMTMKQIAEVFKITEPRVSQLHASALFDLSIKLKQWKDGR